MLDHHTQSNDAELMNFLFVYHKQPGVVFLQTLFCVDFFGALQGSTLCSLFVIYNKSNHVVSTVKQLAAADWK